MSKSESRVYTNNLCLLVRSCHNFADGNSKRSISTHFLMTVLWNLYLLFNNSLSKYRRWLEQTFLKVRVWNNEAFSWTNQKQIRHYQPKVVNHSRDSSKVNSSFIPYPLSSVFNSIKNECTTYHTFLKTQKNSRSFKTKSNVYLSWF